MVKVMMLVLTISIVTMSWINSDTKIVTSIKVNNTKIPKIKVTEYDTLHLDRATRYNATVSQCDDSPFKTADGSHIDPIKVKNGEQRWVALSRDLILDEYRNQLFDNKIHWNGEFKFGDTIYVESENHPFINGAWVVHDCMSASAKNSIDFLTAVNVTPKLGVAEDVKILIKK